MISSLDSSPRETSTGHISPAMSTMLNRQTMTPRLPCNGSEPAWTACTPVRANTGNPSAVMDHM